MDAADRSFLREFFRQVSDIPLQPDDARYVSLYDGDDVDDPVKLLARAIEWTTGQSVQLLSGFRGSGKSTELLRLKRCLTGQDSIYKVVVCDIKEYINLSTPVDVSDFLMALAGALGDALVKEKLLPRHPMKESYWTRFAAFLTRTNVEFTELSAGLKADDLSVGLKSNLKNDPTFRQRLQVKMAGHLGQLVTDVHAYVEECVRHLKEEHGPLTELVLLIDSMEQIRGTSITANAVQSSVETLFAAQSDKLHIPFLHVVYTVPPYLKVRYPNLSSLYEPGGVQVLPAVKVANKEDGSPHAAGVAAMKRIVARRGDWRRLLGDEARLDRLITSSGGHLRDLLRMLAEVIRRADQLPVRDHDMDAAINQIKNEALPIADDDAKWLARIAHTNRASLPEASQLPDLARFLDTHLVLCYRNGDEWYDVHPLIKPEVEAQEVERRKQVGAG